MRDFPCRAAFAALGFFFLCALPLPGSAQVFEDHGDEAVPYRLFLPLGLNPARPVPLVVMLHGCNQNARDFAEVTRMNALAAAESFVVLYPEQQTHPTTCWRWYEPEHQQRGRGEPAAIFELLQEVKARPDLAIDPQQIFVAGLSAGAAMAAILGATYPEVFAAAGLVAGLPYGAAADCLGAFNVMQRISARMPGFGAWLDYWSAYGTCLAAGEVNPVLPALPAHDALGERAHAEMGTRARVLPVIVFQGGADRRVYPENGTDMIGQWAQTGDLATDGLDNDDIDDVAESDSRGGRPGGHGYRRRLYETEEGVVVMAFYAIDAMRHAWPGGAPDRPFSDPEGPDASRLIWEFFAGHPRP